MSLLNNPFWREAWLKRPRPTLWEGGFHDDHATGTPLFYKIMLGFLIVIIAAVLVELFFGIRLIRFE